MGTAIGALPCPIREVCDCRQRGAVEQSCAGGSAEAASSLVEGPEEDVSRHWRVASRVHRLSECRASGGSALKGISTVGNQSVLRKEESDYVVKSGSDSTAILAEAIFKVK